ncbi:MAG TPA: PKD domain-containing protein, partial [Puia sp.]|nr:PKD domain-containing protein [Puia sp.]
YPILIFLHGIGEIGNGSQAQLPKVLVNGPPKLINNKTFPTSFTVNGQNFSFIVVTPQFNSNARNYTVVDNLVKYMTKKYRVDPTRIYLTGLSMGGGISWIYAAGKPEFANNLAALLVVCGNTQPYPANVKILANADLPVKVMHNSGDPTVPVAYSIDWVNDLNASLPPINPPAKLTVFNASGHDAWSKAYDPTYKENGQNVYEWMLSYSRGKANTPPPPPANKPPVANAGSGQTITLPVSSVTLNGSASSDPDGTVASYSWKYVSGPSVPASNTTTAKSIVVSGLIKGTYVFQLTVTDNSGATATSQVTVVVNPAVTVSLPPIAIAGAGVTITLPLSSYQLDGSKSSAPAGSIASYQWSYVSGPSSYNFVSPTSALTVVNKLIAGTYVFQLTVTDNKGVKASSQVTVVVKPIVVTIPPILSNKPPVANAGPNTTITLPLSSFWLDGTKSTDPDGTIVSYAWSKVSGPNSYNITGPTTSRNIVNKLIAGTYVFQLTVKDNSGATNSTQVTLTVNPAKATTPPPPPPPPANNSPIADAGVNTTITLPLSSYWLDGTKSR